MNAPNKVQFKVGDTHTSGEKIEFIYGNSAEVIVFRDSHCHVQWETAAEDLTRTQCLVHQRYDRLYARVVSCLPEGKKRTPLVDELAQALFLGLSDPDEEKALKCFEDVAGRIAHEAQIEARFVYLIAGSVAAGLIVLVSIVAGFFVAADSRAIVLGSGGGAVGAWASVLSRASQLELGPFETPSNLKFQGVTRILLGAIFGVVAIVAMKTGQLFPSGSSNAWITALTTFVSGWSERLVPEIISNLETRAARTAVSPTGAAKT